MRISDWSSDVCSSDLRSLARRNAAEVFLGQSERLLRRHVAGDAQHRVVGPVVVAMERGNVLQAGGPQVLEPAVAVMVVLPLVADQLPAIDPPQAPSWPGSDRRRVVREGVMRFGVRLATQI